MYSSSRTGCARGSNEQRWDVMVWERNKRLAQNLYPKNRESQETFEISYVQAYKEARSLRDSPTRLARKMGNELSYFKSGVPSRSLAVGNPALAGRTVGYVFAAMDADIAHLFSDQERKIFKALLNKVAAFSRFVGAELQQTLRKKRAA